MLLFFDENKNILAEKPSLSLLLVLYNQTFSPFSGRFIVGKCDRSDIGKCLQQWSRGTQALLEQCEQLGVGTRCLPVYYERLVLDTERTVRRVLRFLGLPWTDTVLRHQDFVEANGTDSDTSHNHKIILNKSVHTLLSRSSSTYND